MLVKLTSSETMVEQESPEVVPKLSQLRPFDVEIMSKHHWAKQNLIRLVKYSCAGEVSGPFEVSRFVGIF